MHFVIHCKDIPGHQQVRRDDSRAHVDYLKVGLYESVGIMPWKQVFQAD